LRLGEVKGKVNELVAILCLILGGVSEYANTMFNAKGKAVVRLNMARQDKRGTNKRRHKTPQDKDVREEIEEIEMKAEGQSEAFFSGISFFILCNFHTKLFFISIVQCLSGRFLDSLGLGLAVG
jgi:hypothetical protein